MENRLVRTSRSKEIRRENSGPGFRVHLHGLDGVRAVTVLGTNFLFDFGCGSDQTNGYSVAKGVNVGGAVTGAAGSYNTHISEVFL